MSKHNFIFLLCAEAVLLGFAGTANGATVQLSGVANRAVFPSNTGTAYPSIPWAVTLPISEEPMDIYLDSEGGAWYSESSFNEGGILINGANCLGPGNISIYYSSTNGVELRFYMRPNKQVPTISFEAKFILSSVFYPTPPASEDWAQLLQSLSSSRWVGGAEVLLVDSQYSVWSYGPASRFSVIPEPATILLATMSVIFVGCHRKRRALLVPLVTEGHC
jgi:hypothetical protein